MNGRGVCLDQPSSGMDTYGNWCGGYIGGYLNCCDGGPCAACVNDTVTEERCEPSDACLRECPAKDALDYACAIHDTCLMRPSVLANRPDVPCNDVSNNFCGCDRNFLADLKDLNLRNFPFRFGKAHTFRANALVVFNKLDCWTYEYERIRPVCARSSSTMGYSRATPFGYSAVIHWDSPYGVHENVAVCWADATACNKLCAGPCSPNPNLCTARASLVCGQGLNYSAVDTCRQKLTHEHIPINSLYSFITYTSLITIAALLVLNVTCSGVVYAFEKLRARRHVAGKTRV